MEFSYQLTNVKLNYENNKGPEPELGHPPKRREQSYHRRRRRRIWRSKCGWSASRRFGIDKKSERLNHLARQLRPVQTQFEISTTDLRDKLDFSFLRETLPASKKLKTISSALIQPHSSRWQLIIKFLLQQQTCFSCHFISLHPIFKIGMQVMSF